MLNLDKNLTEYAQNTVDHPALCHLVITEFPPDRLHGHKPACLPPPSTRLGYHGSYKRTRLIDTAGQSHSLLIHLVHCPLCLQTWSIYPSLLVPHKHYDSYVVQNVLEDVLSHEMTYRATTHQNQQLSSQGTPNTDPNLALTSSAIDRQFQRLERKFVGMQQFSPSIESGTATLNAWAIVHDFRRFGVDAKRCGHSPVELAGGDLAGLPWLQFVMLTLSKVQWLQQPSP